MAKHASITTSIRLSIAALALVLAMPAVAQQTTTKLFTDSTGRFAGSLTTRGNNTQFYDSTGRFAGWFSSTSQGNNTHFFDSAGRFAGSSSTHGNVTSYYDRSGRFTGSTIKK
jgi:hypothetical protein